MSVESLLQEILDELRNPSSGGGSGADSEESRISARRKDAITRSEALIALNKDLVEQEKDAEKRLRLKVSLEEERLRLAKEQAIEARAIKNEEAFQEAQEAAQKYNKEIQKLNTQLKNLPDNPFSDFMDLSAINKMRKVTQAAAGAVSGFMNASDAIGTAGSAMTGLISAASQLNPTTMAVEVIKAFATTTAAAVQDADRLRAQFVAITGDASAARDMFIDLTLANTNLAISFEAMQGAQLALRDGFVDFVFLSDQAKESLTLQTATMEKLGVDAATTSESINTLTQAFGMNHDEAIQLQRDMVGLGQALGIPPKTITEEFTRALPALAEFGSEATEVFERLVVASRETGLSIESLTGTFGDAMNTFEGSTRAAGQLNQILGTGMVSGLDLLMGDAEERLRIVQQSLELTGRSFQDLGRFEKIALAQAAGFRSVDEAARAFGNTNEDIATQIGDTTISQAEMTELAEQATDSMTQLKFAFLSFAVAVKPATERFAEMVDTFIDFSSAFPGGVAGMVSLISTAAGAVAVLVPGMQLAGAGLLTTGVLGGIAATTSEAAVQDGQIAFTSAQGVTEVLRVNSNDQAAVLLGKPEGPFANTINETGGNASAIASAVKSALAPLVSQMATAQTPAPAAAGGETRVVFQIDKRTFVDEVLNPAIDGRVLGKE